MNNCCIVFLFCLCFPGIIMGGFIKIIEFQELANWKVWLDFILFFFFLNHNNSLYPLTKILAHN